MVRRLASAQETGQAERMNRTVKEATVRRYHYESHDQLRRHLGDFVAAYNFARRLKALKCLTPSEYMCTAWQREPGRFTADPTHEALVGFRGGVDPEAG